MYISNIYLAVYYTLQSDRREKNWNMHGMTMKMPKTSKVRHQLFKTLQRLFEGPQQAVGGTSDPLLLAYHWGLPVVSPVAHDPLYQMSKGNHRVQFLSSGEAVSQTHKIFLSIFTGPAYEGFLNDHGPVTDSHLNLTHMVVEGIKQRQWCQPFWIPTGEKGGVQMKSINANCICIRINTINCIYLRSSMYWGLLAKSQFPYIWQFSGKGNSSTQHNSGNRTLR